MHSVVLDRIKSQTQPQEVVAAPATTPPPIVPDNPHVPSDELRELLNKNLNVVADTAPIAVNEPVKLFPHLWSFVEWYETNREKFSEQQRIALDTLIQTRDMVNTGCGCKRAHRESVANEYFKSFWLNNQTNDLLPSVLNHVGSQQIKFAQFLTYPA